MSNMCLPFQGRVDIPVPVWTHAVNHHISSILFRLPITVCISLARLRARVARVFTDAEAAQARQSAARRLLS
jgi:hypothetical protein